VSSPKSVVGFYLFLRELRAIAVIIEIDGIVDVLAGVS